MWPFSKFLENKILQQVHNQLRTTAKITLGFCKVAIKSATEVEGIRQQKYVNYKLVYITCPDGYLLPLYTGHIIVLAYLYVCNYRLETYMKPCWAFFLTSDTIRIVYSELKTDYDPVPPLDKVKLIQLIKGRQ